MERLNRFHVRKRLNLGRSGCGVQSLALCLLVLVSGLAICAQTASTGALTGTVTDPSGAVVQNAKVTLRNDGTNETLTAISGQDGLYRFSLLPPGEYDLTVEAAGFSVIGVPDAAAALDTLDVLVPEVVIVAEREEAALALTRDIRSHPAAGHAPVVILGDSSETSALVRALEGGADDYLARPFEPEALIARTRAIIRRFVSEAAVQPLTRLPGNYAIEREMGNRLRERAAWALIYADLDDFKAFNDVYGFVQGDAAIVLLAESLVDAVKRKGGNGDFVGHVGGDDFVVVTTPPFAPAIADETIRSFDRDIPRLYKEEDVRRGRIVTRDRRGNPREYPIMSVSIGIVSSERGSIESIAHAAQIAAELKSLAKQRRGSIVVTDKRR